MAELTMREQAADFGRQLREGGQAAAALPQALGPVSAIALCGLGGSAAGARLAIALIERELRIPVVVVGDSRLPGWIGPSTLVVATSYSGNTLETLSAWRAAGERGALRVAVTAGGALAADAAAAGAGRVAVEGGFAPRGALGLLLAPLLSILHRAGAIDDPAALLARAADAADAVHADGAPARAAAARLAARPLVVYGSGMRAAAALRIKNQINENAKACVFAGALPEVAHNEVLGWIGSERDGAPFSLVVLRDPAETALEAALADGVLAEVGPHAAHAEEWRGEGADEIARTFSLLALGDLVSCALGDAAGVELDDIAMLQALKARLAAGGS